MVSYVEVTGVVKHHVFFVIGCVESIHSSRNPLLYSVIMLCPLEQTC